MEGKYNSHVLNRQVVSDGDGKRGEGESTTLEKSNIKWGGEGKFEPPEKVMLSKY